MEIPKPNLVFPIEEYLPEIRQELARASSLIIKASPGAGKTTRVPLALLAEGHTVIMVQPRRIAAKLAATWMAKALGEEVGQTVGYQIRFEAKMSPKTRILVVTEGLLTRRLMDDPSLSGFSAVILDEFHERHIHGDLALALVKGLMGQRRELKLIVMSATLETQELEGYLDRPRVFDIPGRAYPIEVEYHPPHNPFESASKNRGVFGLWESHIAQKILDMSVDQRCPGHILVFLNGAAEIRAVAQRLRGAQGLGQVLILTAETSQDFVEPFFQSNTQKVILATNVAETSITLPGVTGVIDGGYAKQSGFAAWNGLPTLEVQKISQASCIQRSGRAGRTAPGLCFRLFSESDFRTRPPFAEPEIRRADLCQTVLELKSMGRKIDLNKFRWFEEPKTSQIEFSETLLKALGALDKEGQLTPDGAKMAQWPLHPRLGRMVIEGLRVGIPEAMLLAVSLFNEGMVTHQEYRVQESSFCDITYLVNLFLRQKSDGFQVFDGFKTQKIMRVYQDMRSLIGCGAVGLAAQANAELIRRCVFRAFADRVAKLRVIETTHQAQKKAIYHFCFGKEGVLHHTSVIDHHPWIVALEAQESLSQDSGGRRGRILWATAIDESWLFQDPFGLLRKTRETMVDPKNQRPSNIEATYYQEVLVAKHLTHIGTQEKGVQVILQSLRDSWEKSFDNLLPLKIYHWKLATLERLGVPHKMPKLEGEYLDILQQSLVEGASTLDHVLKCDLTASVLSLLDDEDQNLLQRMFPDQFLLASGKKIQIHYGDDGPPLIKAKIQEFFGQKIHPTVCQGKLPVVIHLLAPNQRPTQVTSDLPGFWQSSYGMVKKELKARYPKHSWPDDPTQKTPPYKKTFGR